MERADLMATVHQLAARLPFSINDTEEVNRRFELSKAKPDPAEEEILQLWTYCFIRRYFLIKFAKDPSAPVADFDMIVETTFVRVYRGQQKMRDYTRYANWVSVICKNTFLNYLRSRKRQPMVSLDDQPELEQEDETGVDTVLVRAAVECAIERLPEFLRETARLRFLTDVSYEEMARRMGKSVPTIRSYVNKVLNRFRRDTKLVSLLRDQVMS